MSSSRVSNSVSSSRARSSRARNSRVSNSRVSNSRVSNSRASKRVGDSLAIERKVIVKVPRLSVVVVASDRHWIGLQAKGSSELL